MTSRCKSGYGLELGIGPHKSLLFVVIQSRVSCPSNTHRLTSHIQSNSLFLTNHRSSQVTQDPRNQLPSERLSSGLLFFTLFYNPLSLPPHLTSFFTFSFSSLSLTLSSSFFLPFLLTSLFLPPPLLHSSLLHLPPQMSTK